MPIKKTRLSRAEHARYLERIKELKAAQVDCEVPDDWQENPHDLEIFTAPPGENILCELPSGVTAYAIGVRLVAQRSNLRLEDCTIVSPWDSQSISLCLSERGLYRVGSAVEFTEAEALNGRIENGLCFHQHGDVDEGWLVASSLKPIPENYRDRMITNLSLRFTDQFGREYIALADAVLDRSARATNSVSRVRRFPGLFESETPRNEFRSRNVTPNTLRTQPEGREGAVHPQHRR